MEKDKQVIFLSDIKKHFRKQEYITFVVLLVIALPIFLFCVHPSQFGP